MIGQLILWVVLALLAVAVVGGGVAAIVQGHRDLRSTPKDGKR